jgi:23S rRNA (pseudouridine1915-N3)-methyltransferase
VIELAESRLGDQPSEKEIANALEQEARASEVYLSKKGAFNIAMCIEGKQLTSTELSEKLTECSVSGFSTVNFFIGSSFGLSDRIKQACQLRLSMSKLTFPHQLARIMLLEQLYRAFQIAKNSRYHK